MNNCRKKIYFPGMVVIFYALSLLVIPASSQENTNTWGGPLNVSDSPTGSVTPSLTVTADGNVHVVWNEVLDRSQSLIYYSHFDGESWSVPVDILSDTSARLPAIIADSIGYLHVIWRGFSGISYSNAFAPTAGAVRNWRLATPLFRERISGTNPDLAIDKLDGLHAVYTDQNQGVYYAYSPDRGEHWLGPYVVSSNITPSRMVDKARIAVAPDGRLHVVWVEYNFPESFPPLGIRYAFSSNGGKIWSNELSLADGPYDDPGIAMRNDQEVHVVWSGTSPDRFKFHRWSPDNGEDWSNVWRDTALGGYQGWADLATDGEQNLHWLQVGTVYQIYNDSLYYEYWSGKRWSTGEVVYKNVTGGDNPAFVSAAVALGNELHMVFQYPLALAGGKLQSDVFYFHRKLDAGSIEVREFALPVPLASPTTLAKTEMQSRSISPSQLIEVTEGDSIGYGPWPSIIFGVFLGFLPLAILIFIRILRYGR
jgi:hypothetical protein